MIKATVIHGSEAVKEFDRTGKYPSKEWLEENSCSVEEKTFATEEEYHAYCEALEENDGYDDWRIHGVVNTKKTVSAPLDIQLRNLTQQFINRLRMLPLRPEGWLPHVVYVEEEEDYPVYTRYKLEEFQEDGSCVLVNHITGERFTDRKLYEINVDWIDTVCSRYFECIIEQDLWKEHALIVLRRECNESDRVIQEFVDSLWQKGRPDDENIALFYEWRYPDEPAFQKNDLLKLTDNAISIVSKNFGNAPADYRRDMILKVQRNKLSDDGIWTTEVVAFGEDDVQEFRSSMLRPITVSELRRYIMSTIDEYESIKP